MIGEEPLLAPEKEEDVYVAEEPAIEEPIVPYDDTTTTPPPVFVYPIANPFTDDMAGDITYYYPDTENVKCLVLAQPDADGAVFYQYLNEYPEVGADRGRVDIILYADGTMEKIEYLSESIDYDVGGTIYADPVYDVTRNTANHYIYPPGSATPDYYWSEWTEYYPTTGETLSFGGPDNITDIPIAGLSPISEGAVEAHDFWMPLFTDSTFTLEIDRELQEVRLLKDGVDITEPVNAPSNYDVVLDRENGEIGLGDDTRKFYTDAATGDYLRMEAYMEGNLFRKIYADGRNETFDTTTGALISSFVPEKTVDNAILAAESFFESNLGMPKATILNVATPPELPDTIILTFGFDTAGDVSSFGGDSLITVSVDAITPATGGDTALFFENIMIAYGEGEEASLDLGFFTVTGDETLVGSEILLTEGPGVEPISPLDQAALDLQASKQEAMRAAQQDYYDDRFTQEAPTTEADQQPPPQGP